MTKADIDRTVAKLREQLREFAKEAIARDQVKYMEWMSKNRPKDISQWVAQLSMYLPTPAHGRGRPSQKLLVHLIRSRAVEECAQHGKRGDKYQRAAELLDRLDPNVFHGLCVHASASQMKKSHAAIRKVHLAKDTPSTLMELLRSAVPLGDPDTELDKTADDLTNELIARIHAYINAHIDTCITDHLIAKTAN